MPRIMVLSIYPHSLERASQAPQRWGGAYPLGALWTECEKRVFPRGELRSIVRRSDKENECGAGLSTNWSPYPSTPLSLSFPTLPLSALQLLIAKGEENLCCSGRGLWVW